MQIENLKKASLEEQIYHDRKTCSNNISISNEIWIMFAMIKLLLIILQGKKNIIPTIVYIQFNNSEKGNLVIYYS